MRFQVTCNTSLGSFLQKNSNQHHDFVFLDSYANGQFVFYGFCLYHQEGILIVEDYFCGDLDLDDAVSEFDNMNL